MEMKELKEKAEEYAEKHAFRAPYDGYVDYKASVEGYIKGATVTTRVLRKENESLKKDNELLWKRIDKYKEDLKKLRVAFIQSQAMILTQGSPIGDMLKEMSTNLMGKHGRKRRQDD